ncbi:MAG TPA: VWA domain-containing protein, partial [Pseudonocardia sp.]|nr:VWA domain-containing protein [Pseudonocardia sp.]
MAPGRTATRRQAGAILRPVLAVVVALLLPALTLLATATRAAAQPGGPDGAASGGTEGFVSCLNTNRAGDVLLLFDESQSLRTTDPQAARVAAATYLLGRLAQASDAVKLDVALSGFSSAYTSHVPWTALDEGSLGGLQDGVRGFAARDDGVDTDYRAALEGARRELADKARATGGSGRCQALIWLSDGQLDYAVRTPALRVQHGTVAPLDPDVEITDADGVARAVAQATEKVCGSPQDPASGIADGLRVAGVTTIGIGLTAGGPPDTTFDLMRSITTGAADGRTCGTRLDPVPGSFETASNIDELLFAFDRIDPNGSVEESVKGICQVPDPAQCIEERHRFVLDTSVDKVHILGRADVPGIEALLIPPPQDPGHSRVQGLDRTPRPLDVPGVSATYAWETDRTVSIDLAAAGSGAWSGEWSVLFVDPTGRTAGQQSHTNIHIEGDLLPALHDAGSVTLRSGGVTSGLDIGLARTDGSRVDPASVPGQVGLTATLVTPDGRRVPILQNASKTAIGGPSSVDLSDVAPGPATLDLTLDVTTARADGTPGTRLAPREVQLPLTVAAAPNYPTVTGPVDFGVGENTTTLTASLTVRGPGCVWLDAPPALQTAPERAGPLTVTAGTATSAQTCLTVAEGATAQLPLTLTTQTVGNGIAAGSIPVRTAPVDARDRVQTVPVRFTADLRKPLDVYRFVVALVAALLASALPVLVLYLIKWWGARIPPGRGLHAVSVPVQIVDGRVTRDGQPFALRDGELRDLVPLTGRGAREVRVDGGV